MPVDSTLVRDVVVIIPGIMGSELVDKTGRPLWSVRPGALARALRTLGGSLRDLELPKGIGNDAPDDRVRPGGLIDSLHVIPGLWSPVVGYDGLMSFLRSDRFHLVDAVPGDDGVMPNLVAFPYDWRLSNRYNARRLAKIAIPALERWRRQPGMRDAKLVLVCHSMGGLIARWFAEQESGRDYIRTIITIGTPYRGALRALDTLVNGLEPGLGPLTLDLTAFARSLPSLYQLLPQYDCLDTADGRVSLSTVACPGLDPTMLADAIAFHTSIADDSAPAYALHKVVGTRQPTLTTARVAGDGVEVSTSIDGRDQGGDGTVPRLAAELLAGRGRDVHEVANQHGELQGTRAALDLLDGILSRQEIVWQGAADGNPFGVSMAEVWAAGEAPHLDVTNMDDRRLRVRVSDELGEPVGRPIAVQPDGSASLGPLPEGGYRAVVESVAPGGPPPVGKPFLVPDPSAGTP